MDILETRTSTNFQNILSYAKILSGSCFYWLKSSPSSLIPLLYALGDTFLVQAHAAVTTALQRLAETWWNVFIAYNDLLPNYLDDRIISAEVCSAIVRLRYSDQQLLRTLDQTTLFLGSSSTRIWRS